MMRSRAGLVALGLAVAAVAACSKGGDEKKAAAQVGRRARRRGAEAGPGGAHRPDPTRRCCSRRRGSGTMPRQAEPGACAARDLAPRRRRQVVAHAPRGRRLQRLPQGAALRRRHPHDRRRGRESQGLALRAAATGPPRRCGPEVERQVQSPARRRDRRRRRRRQGRDRHRHARRRRRRGRRSRRGRRQAEVTEIDEKPDTFVHEIEIGDIDGDGKLEFFATPSDRNSASGSQAGRRGHVQVRRPEIRAQSGSSTRKARTPRRSSRATSTATARPSCSPCSKPRSTPPTRRSSRSPSRSASTTCSPTAASRTRASRRSRTARPAFSFPAISTATARWSWSPPRCRRASTT